MKEAEEGAHLGQAEDAVKEVQGRGIHATMCHMLPLVEDLQSITPHVSSKDTN